MSDFVMTIAGEAAPTEGTFGVRNPATGEVFAQAPECTRQQLDAAFDAAAKAARDWKADEAARRAVLLQAADVLMASTAELAPVLTAEQGKPLSDAGIEVFASAIWCQYFANLEMPTQIIQDDDTAYVELARRPLGVVAAITPWNFPLTLAFWKIAPALLAGNTLGAQALALHPADHAEGRRAAARRLPARRGQHRERRRRARRLDDLAPGAAQDQLHRLGRDGQEGGRCRRRPTSSASPSSSAATTRPSCSTTPTRPRWPRRSSPARSTTTARCARPSSASTSPRPSTTTWSRAWRRTPAPSRSARAPRRA